MTSRTVAPPTFTELSDIAAIAVPAHGPDFQPETIFRHLIADTETPLQSRPLLGGSSPFAPDWLTNWHASATPPPRDVACYFATDVIVSGKGQLWMDGKLVVSPELMPDYIYKFTLGLPQNAEPLLHVHELPLRVVEDPCVVLPGGLNVYGHFLIETLFYLLTVRRAWRDTRVQCKYLVPNVTAPWMLQILHEDLRIPRDAVVLYHPSEERVLLRKAILPTLLHRSGGFHPFANNLLADLSEWLGPLPPPTSRSPRLFLVRNNYRNPSHFADRECVNEAQLLYIAQVRHGFAAVAMERLAWREQIATLRDANIVLGQFGSAMHATLFCGAATRVGVLGLLNLTQSFIGALRNQAMGYLATEFEARGQFRIDETQFSDFLDVLCN